MSTYTWKSCPHCKHQYKVYSTYTTFRDETNGCPIVTCKRCGRQFFDKSIREPAFSSPPADITILHAILGSLWPFGIGGIALLIIGIATGYWGVIVISLLAFAAYGYLVYIGIKKRGEINGDIKREYWESKQRLADKEYVALLIKLGYHVPDQFLRDNFPDLLK